MGSQRPLVERLQIAADLLGNSEAGLLLREAAERLVEMRTALNCTRDRADYWKTRASDVAGDLP